MYNLSKDLEYRGYLCHHTFDDLAKLDQEKFNLYLGTDPTGDSLHVGHLAMYILARRFLDAGHQVNLLIGDGTAQVGDPRDTEERNLISPEEIKINTKKLTAQVKKIFEGQDFKIINNAKWLNNLNLLDFLRDTGKYFGMGMLIDRDHFKARVGEGKSGMSFAEFTYTLLQGYDFWYLHKNTGVNLQIGGSDQWGNLLSGVELIRKKEGVQVNVIAAPLVIDKATGRKFGKSESGEGIWLDPKKTSPFKFYQFWLNVSDESVIDYLKLYTFLSEKEISILETEVKQNPSAREAQRILAFVITRLVHGVEVANSVKHATEALFSGKGLSDIDFLVLEEELPVGKIGQTVTEILTGTKIAASNSEARRLIQANAISLNGEKIQEDQIINEKTLLKKGKNQFVLIS